MSTLPILHQIAWLEENSEWRPTILGLVDRYEDVHRGSMTVMVSLFNPEIRVTYAGINMMIVVLREHPNHWYMIPSYVRDDEHMEDIGPFDDIHELLAFATLLNN